MQWVDLRAVIQKKKWPIAYAGHEVAKSKGSNGVVAVGLHHRNYSVLKQTPYQ